MSVVTCTYTLYTLLQPNIEGEGKAAAFGISFVYSVTAPVGNDEGETRPVARDTHYLREGGR